MNDVIRSRSQNVEAGYRLVVCKEEMTKLRSQTLFSGYHSQFKERNKDSKNKTKNVKEVVI